MTQQPIDGISFAYTFAHPDAPERHREQYFAMLGNRAFYSDGWLAATIPGRKPWDQAHGPQPKDFRWALYDLKTDYSQSRDLAASEPGRLRALQAKFDAAARRYHVYPLDADLNARMAPHYRPDLLGRRDRYVYHAGGDRYTNYAFPSLTNGWRISAQVGTAGRSSTGPILVQGDHFGGQALILDAGRPVFLLQPAAGPALALSAPEPLPAGTHAVSIAFLPRPGGAAGTRIEMRVDGAPAAFADSDRVVRGRGDAYIGRAGVAPFSYDPALPPIADSCACDIGEVTIERILPR